MTDEPDDKERGTLELPDATASKGRSPFYPGQPVPVELFAGRAKQIDHILERGAGQVALGKPVAMYVQGEYGIGKSSIAGFCQWVSAKNYGLHPIYAPIGAAQSMADVGAAVLEATVRSGAMDSKRGEIVRNMLAKYIGEQSLFGVTIHAENLKADAPAIASGLLPFLQQVFERLREDGVKGIFLVLDEIDAVAANPQFAHLVKGLVDTNAMTVKLPLLLMLCGVEERRREMIRHHQPVDRIFDIVDIEAMSREEMETFFTKAFDSVHMSLDPDALSLMTHYGGGFPKILHLIGDAVYWVDKDMRIDDADVIDAVLIAAEEVGQKFVEQQVFRALRSKDYRSIFDKIARTGLKMKFTKAEIARGLSDSQQKKLNNFLQKMKQLNVIRSGDTMGEYVFNQRMVRMYIWLESQRGQLDADTERP